MKKKSICTNLFTKIYASTANHHNNQLQTNLKEEKYQNYLKQSRNYKSFKIYMANLVSRLAY